VEHLLAALVALGIDNACIEVNGPELPLLDGSARDWVDAIASVARQGQKIPRRKTRIKDPIWIYDGDAFVAALPAPIQRFTYGIDFEAPAIGNQWHSWSPASDGEASFMAEVAPARTFGLAHQIDYLRSQGLIQGGSLNNALVCDGKAWVNPPLRFANEPVRHKMLDLIGDLSLLGVLPEGHILAYKASHKLHVQLAQALQSVLEFA
jgi:UDP-3-O-[3-hydroxymyristoyl] N-acetylglucosamine deacetylase